VYLLLLNSSLLLLSHNESRSETSEATNYQLLAPFPAQLVALGNFKTYSFSFSNRTSSLTSLNSISAPNSYPPSSVSTRGAIESAEANE
jgi:hypothetical protein